MNSVRDWFTKGPKPVWIRYVILIAAVSGIIRIALGTPWMRESALFYVLIPYLTGVAIYLVTPQQAGNGYWKRLWRHVRTALIVMLSTSLILFEGFLCVLMFLPIYVVFAMLVVALDKPTTASGQGRTLRSSLIPIIVVLVSLDGIGNVGPDRQALVSRTAVLRLTPDQIRANIIDHAYPDTGRSAFLSLFPRPVSVDAKSMEIGARHVAHMEYRRWGLAGINVHRGQTVLEITNSGPDKIQAQFVYDDSYLSHYMKLQNWSMELTPLGPGQTQVTLTLGYERKLAPGWYFGPLQKRAVEEGLDYVLSQIVGATT